MISHDLQIADLERPFSRQSAADFNQLVEGAGGMGAYKHIAVDQFFDLPENVQNLTIMAGDMVSVLGQTLIRQWSESFLMGAAVGWQAINNEVSVELLAGRLDSYPVSTTLLSSVSQTPRAAEAHVATVRSMANDGYVKATAHQPFMNYYWLPELIQGTGDKTHIEYGFGFAFHALDHIYRNANTDMLDFERQVFAITHGHTSLLAEINRYLDPQA